MKQIGKQTVKWLKFRKEYLKGKENFEGYYICELGREWTKSPELDHIEQRSLRPDLIFEESNIRILCTNCHRKVTK